MQDKTWTIKEILTWTQDYLTQKKIDAPRTTSELILSKALDLTRLKLYINFDRTLTKEELKEYKSYVQRTAAGEPVQYITGCQEFWSLDFRVTPDVLIPRSDTETLVEAVVDDIKNPDRSDVSIFELGTGSGIVSVSIAHELKKTCNLKITAVDISGKALEIAGENAKNNNVDELIEFIESDGFGNIPGDDRYDYIVSNPPYISSRYYKNLENKVREFEPKIALFGGEDGLTFYKDIFSLGYEYLNEDGKIFVEIDFRKKDELEGLIDKDKYSGLKYHKDLAGHDRVLELIKK